MDDAHPRLANPVAPVAATRSARLAYRAAAVLLILPAASLAASSGTFAAVPAASTFAAPDDGMPLVRVLFALLLVLGAVFAAAKLSRRAGMSGGTAAVKLEILAQTALGPREKAVLLRVGGRHVLLGVATGNVRLLLDVPSTTDLAEGSGAPPKVVSDAAVDTPARPNFRDLLMRSLGR